MRHPAIIMFAIALIVFTGCGRPPMTENEAVETLANVQMSSGQTSSEADAEVTVDNFNAMVQRFAVSDTRAAVSSSAPKLDLSLITQVIQLLQSQTQNGQKPNLMSLVNALLAMNSNSTAPATGSKLESILALINQLAPLISTFAPQFAPILAAVTTFLPLVINIINMFKKPKPAAFFEQPYAVLRASA